MKLIQAMIVSTAYLAFIPPVQAQTSSTSNNSLSSQYHGKTALRSVETRPDGTRVMSIEDQEGSLTEYVYDNQGRLISETAPEIGNKTFSYDDKDRLSLISSNGLISQTRKYDKFDRLASVQHTKVHAAKVSTEYDYESCVNSAGNLCRVIHDGLITSYQYQANSKLKQIAITIDGDVKEKLDYVYNDTGLLLQTKYPSGLDIEYKFDSNRRIVRILGSYAAKDTYEQFVLLKNAEYDDSDNVTSFTHGNGVLTEISRNDEGKPSSITLKREGKILDKLEYNYTQNGLLKEISYPEAGEDILYNYLDGRLVSEENGLTKKSIQFTYDDVGNRLSMSDDGKLKNIALSQIATG